MNHYESLNIFTIPLKMQKKKNQPIYFITKYKNMYGCRCK